MSAQQLLAGYGVSMQDAYDFVIAHLNQPQTIIGVAVQFGITNDMLAEIVNTHMSGVTGVEVKSFFAGFGIDSSALDSPNIVPTTPIIPNPTQQRIDLDINKMYSAFVDAGSGAFHYVIDLSKVVGAHGFEMQNFGADDSVTVTNVLNPDVTVLGVNRDPVVTFFGRADEVSASITFAGVNPSKASIITVGQFNELPVGDVFIA